MTIKPISPQKCNAKWLNELVGHEPSYLPCISLVDHLKKKKNKKNKNKTCALCSSLLCFPSVQQRGIYPDHALSW